jgi:hypothetical protein
METEIVTAELIKVLNLYKNALLDYTEEQFNHKQAEDIWSIGQMYEHLAVSANYFFLKNIKYCLENRNGQMGGEMNAKGENVFKYNGFPPIKVKVPGGGPDPIAQNLNIYSTIFDNIIEQLEQQLPIILANDGNYKTLHPVFGWHSALEWLHSFEMHHRHHLRQKKELNGYLGIEK